MSKIINIIWNRGTMTASQWICVCFSHFHHYLTMLLLNSQIWINFRKDKIKFFAADITFKNWFSIGCFHLARFRFFPISKFEKFGNPFYLRFRNASEFKDTSMMRLFERISMFNIVHVKAPIAIYITSKIRYFKFIHNVSPIMYCKAILNALGIIVQPERLKRVDMHYCMKRKSALI